MSLSPALGRPSSVTSRRSSAIYQLPPLAPPSPPLPAPPPTPAQFLFFPLPTPKAITPKAQANAQHAQLYLFGWNGTHASLVAGLLLAIDENDAQQRLDSTFNHLNHHLIILGTASTSSNPPLDAPSTSSPSFHIHLSSTLSPTLTPTTPPTTLILYTPPKRSQLQFLSLVPLQLDLNSFDAPPTPGSSTAAKKAEAEARKKRDKEGRTEEHVLGEKLRRSAKLDFTSPSNAMPVAVADLEEVVDWINLAPHLTSLLSPPSPSLRSSISFPSTLASILSPPTRLVRAVAQGILTLTAWELPLLGGTALKDLSATVQQIDTRLTQGLSWPSQYSLIRTTLSASSQTSDMPTLALGRAHYIQFYNTMWLIANDMIVGSAFTSFVCENSEYLGGLLGRLVQEYTLTSLRELLLWLNDWPGGVKLNFELASIFCDGFLWGTGLWEELIFAPLLPFLPTMVYLLGLSGLLGTTMFFSFASDLLALLTFHIFVFYLMATSIFRWHLSMLGALFNIFRGKKFNVLRNRVEPAVYEVDQLLLGTILFTLAAFLFPTVLVYYLAFAASRLGIVALHAAMETALAFMNHFPLFAVMLRFKDPARLPGGLQFELDTSPEEEPLLRMTVRPRSLALALLSLSRFSSLTCLPSKRRTTPSTSRASSSSTYNSQDDWLPITARSTFWEGC
ncbi:N-acetylglucosaminyl transferase component-domain-containing protein [Leucosporidium creatinivorum]|uniref:N-acetylglucosaminyl transferase component-domain-containing protein n=1 Tax=Leucosporidium creatinivorum TaxID=106004 RepID=A0A1Y2C355_9BASI|nr:N-acetylglucosaminyl transferase component-domain-containing protein [Leucosporidium creatinivorum]